MNIKNSFRLLIWNQAWSFKIIWPLNLNQDIFRTFLFLLLCIIKRRARQRMIHFLNWQFKIFVYMLKMNFKNGIDQKAWIVPHWSFPVFYPKPCSLRIVFMHLRHFLFLWKTSSSGLLLSWQTTFLMCTA